MLSIEYLHQMCSRVHLEAIFGIFIDNTSIGAAFTRIQTLFLRKKFPAQLANELISYGSCQFPTMGFIVERYRAIQEFQCENFWKIEVRHRKDQQDQGCTD